MKCIYSKLFVYIICIYWCDAELVSKNYNELYNSVSHEEQEMNELMSVSRKDVKKTVVLIGWMVLYINTLILLALLKRYI